MSGAGRALPLAALFGLVGAAAYGAHVWLVQRVEWAELGLLAAAAAYGALVLAGRRVGSLARSGSRGSVRARRAAGAGALGLGLLGLVVGTVAPALQPADYLAKLALVLAQVPLLLLGYEALREPTVRRPRFSELLARPPEATSPVPAPSPSVARAPTGPAPAGEPPITPTTGQPTAPAEPSEPTPRPEAEAQRPPPARESGPVPAERRGEGAAPPPAEPSPAPPGETAPVPTPLLGRRLAQRQREATAELRQAIREAIAQDEAEEGEGRSGEPPRPGTPSDPGAARGPRPAAP